MMILTDIYNRSDIDLTGDGEAFEVDVQLQIEKPT